MSSLSLRVALAASLHITASVVLTWSTYHLFRYYAIPPGITLTAVHLLITTLVLVIALVLGRYRLKRLRLNVVLRLSVSYVALLLMRQVTLFHNAIDVYHLMCVVLIPVVALISDIVLRTTPYQGGFTVLMRLTTWCVLVAAAGMSLATVHTIACTHMSLALALATAWLTIYVRHQAVTLPHTLHCSCMQLLLYHAPLSTLLLVPFVLYSEDVQLRLFLPCPDTWWPLFWTGCCAFVWHITGLVVLSGSESVLLYSMLDYVSLTVVYSVDAWRTQRGLSVHLVGGLTVCLVSTMVYFTIQWKRQGKPVTHKQT